MMNGWMIRDTGYGLIEQKRKDPHQLKLSQKHRDWDWEITHKRNANQIKPKSKDICFSKKKSRPLEHSNLRPPPRGWSFGFERSSYHADHDSSKWIFKKGKKRKTEKQKWGWKIRFESTGRKERCEPRVRRSRNVIAIQCGAGRINPKYLPCGSDWWIPRF